jgi:hypothetical protein
MKSLKTILFGLFTFVLLAGIAKSASAWTWVLHHGGQALNTNNNFARINGGGPRLSTWSLNHNDPYQRISFVGNGTHADGSFRFMLVQQSTGLCINTYRPTNWSKINTFACNRNDPQQQFKLNVLRDYGNGAMDVMVQVSNTNFCIDTPNRVNGGDVIIWGCEPTNPNQVFRMDKVSDYIANIAGVAPSNAQSTVYRDEVVNVGYKVIMSNIRPIQPTNLGAGNFETDEAGTFGHTWITLTKQWDVDRVGVRGTTIVSRSRVKSGEYEFTTLSSSGENLVPEYDNPLHRKWSQFHFNNNRAIKLQVTRGEAGTKNLLGVIPGATYLPGNRTLNYYPLTITEEQYKRFLPTSKGGNQKNYCANFNLLEPPGNDSYPLNCSCSSYAYRIFQELTNFNYINGDEFLEYQ